ncbi:MAG: hypothetical protein PHV37_09155 [Candidatus Gastranaerophilales bacterium]|nr:hypothetical protein [Candidatus Gastranaerophilales bacterium]
MRKLDPIDAVELTREVWEQIESSESGILSVNKLQIGAIQFDGRKYFLIENTEMQGAFTKADIGSIIIYDNHSSSIFICNRDLFDGEFSYIGSELDKQLADCRKVFEQEKVS